MNTLELIRSKKSDILAIATRHGAKNVRVFGSVARGEDTDTSDVDLLVSMEKNRSLYDLIGLQQEIQDILKRNVDVLTDRSIN
ncbi:MAG: nucleotidyltransferase family protein [Methylotenera sp.]|nr:nucleotidyltransferase family protein [Methylotenera sp.]MDP1959957.1 nucleotidyltransferase family protein [Methylotenera sp.]MDP3207088.1 nucleotidyltransferase family protein [Methylotenera sp.]MDP3302550.1 nucleotidyltransferase family protein [Methylotenera sp.]MDP3942549.1 nucleotidyltransferase family protein [Methylotenera sp.]